jgi:hypothetical protein
MTSAQCFRGACKGLVCASIVVTSAGCTAGDAPDSWRADCVGRLQVSFPSPVEAAATPIDYLAPRMSLTYPKGVAKFAFSDGSAAEYVTLAHSTGSLLIGQPQSGADLHALLEAHVTTRLIRAKKLYEGKVSSTGAKYSFSVVNTGVATATAWRVDPNETYVAAQVGDRLVDMALNDGLPQTAGDATSIPALIGSLQPRPTFTVPSEPGVCLPYTFVRDDGKKYRYISMTYLLNDHPDVQVTIKDATAANPEPGIRTKNAEPKAVTVGFWSQQLTQAKEVRPLWEPSTRAVTLAGYGGLASFVQLTREDGSIDYGYLAVVRGDPNAKEDTPDLMLFIIRDGKAAKAKGKMALGKDEFIKMAETIAGSVKRRPVQ